MLKKHKLTALYFFALKSLKPNVLQEIMIA